MNNSKQSKFSVGPSPVSIGVIATLIAAWFLLTPRVIPELAFPSPASVWDALAVLRLQLVEDAAVTLARVFTGWVIGCALGIVVGLLMTRNRQVLSAANPIIEMIRP